MANKNLADQIQFRVSKPEHKHLVARAEQKGLSVSNYVRLSMRADLSSDINTKDEVSYLCTLLVKLNQLKRSSKNANVSVNLDELSNNIIKHIKRLQK